MLLSGFLQIDCNKQWFRDEHDEQRRYRMKNTMMVLAMCLVVGNTVSAETAKTPDADRAQQIKEMKWGMFVCWSFSTFGGQEWTMTQDKDASYFRATGADTDQWCKTAQEAGMGYILFLTKHHDGFCLWDTATTEKKVVLLTAEA